MSVDIPRSYVGRHLSLGPVLPQTGICKCLFSREGHLSQYCRLITWPWSQRIIILFIGPACKATVQEFANYCFLLTDYLHLLCMDLGAFSFSPVHSHLPEYWFICDCRHHCTCHKRLRLPISTAAEAAVIYWCRPQPWRLVEASKCPLPLYRILGLERSSVVLKVTVLVGNRAVIQTQIHLIPKPLLLPLKLREGKWHRFIISSRWVLTAALHICLNERRKRFTFPRWEFRMMFLHLLI